MTGGLRETSHGTPRWQAVFSARSRLIFMVYTPTEMEQMRERPFISHALTTGKVMYESDTA